jgi:hypothetical protein
MDTDRHRLILRDDDETAAEGPQIAGEGGRFGPEWGAGREPHGGSGYAPIGPGHFHCAVTKRLMVQFGQEKTSQSPITHAIQQAQGVAQAGGVWERQAAAAVAAVTAGRVYPGMGSSRRGRATVRRSWPALTHGSTACSATYWSASRPRRSTGSLSSGGRSS